MNNTDQFLQGFDDPGSRTIDGIGRDGAESPGSDRRDIGPLPPRVPIGDRHRFRLSHGKQHDFGVAHHHRLHADSRVSRPGCSSNVYAAGLFERERAGTVAIAWNQVVDEILGDASGVNGLRIREAANGKARVLDVHGVFIAVGHTLNTQLFEGQLDMRGGYIVVKSGLEGDATATSVPGVFAAGDVADHVYRQAVTSAGTGCMAALDADKYLESLGTR